VFRLREAQHAEQPVGMEHGLGDLDRHVSVFPFQFSFADPVEPSDRVLDFHMSLRDAVEGERQLADPWIALVTHGNGGLRERFDVARSAD
jgi:hypothetical protein